MNYSSSLALFLKASSLHIGAAAATAALRDELVAAGRIHRHQIDAAYAVSRFTPGTNLLALYALLGHRLGGWSLALKAIAVGVLVPSIVALIIAWAYTHYSSPILTAAMGGARAGGVAVLLGAAVRLLKPQLADHPRVAGVFAGTMVPWLVPVSLFVVLLVAGATGAMLLRPEA
jgi:chromate transport protein ChrA